MKKAPNHIKTMISLLSSSPSILSSVSIVTNGAYERPLQYAMPMCIVEEIDPWPSYLILLFIAFVLIYANAVCKYKTHIFFFFFLSFSSSFVTAHSSLLQSCYVCTLGSRTICRHFKIERGILYTMKIIAIISFSRAWKFTEEEKKPNLWTVSTVLSGTWFNHFKSTDLVFMRKPVCAIKLLIVQWKDH